MKIDLVNAGKRFNREWVFRRFSYSFFSQKTYAITGPNGSGKSTLLQVLCGASQQSEGDLKYHLADKEILPDQVYKHFSFAAPYLDLIEEMTLNEFFSFHAKMKGWIKEINGDNVIETLGLERSANKQIRNYSSGMKQRVKLAQAIFSDVEVILLDEPATNLDEEGIMLYKLMIEKFCTSRLVIVSSNDKNEYSFCEEIIDMRNYK